jgi:hypothetical protein
MEYTKSEINLVHEVMVEASEAQIRELNDLQLLLVGGGIGDPLAL